MRSPPLAPPKENRERRRYRDRGNVLATAWAWGVKWEPNEPTKSIAKRIEERKLDRVRNPYTQHKRRDEIDKA